MLMIADAQLVRHEQVTDLHASRTHIPVASAKMMVSTLCIEPEKSIVVDLKPEWRKAFRGKAVHQSF
jgi:hypothetical protein